MKCAALENRSTTTRITLFPLEVGRPVMKSMETWDHGRAGMGSGSSRPAGPWLLDLCCAQTGHAFTKVLTSPRILGHQNLLRINSKVHCTPAWTVRRVEWPHCKTCDLVELGTKRPVQFTIEDTGLADRVLNGKLYWRHDAGGWKDGLWSSIPFREVKLAGEGVCLCVLRPGPVRKHKVKTAKEQCPPCLPRVQSSCLLDIGQVLVVCPDLERVFRPLQPVAPFHECQLHSQ